MKAKQIIDAPMTFVLIFESGDEVVSELLKFAKSHSVKSGSLTALGAFETCVLGYFDWTTKDYKKNPIDQQVELLSLIGNIAEGDDGPKVHAHVVVGLSDATTRGGHLVSAKVRPTLEVTLVESTAPLVRKMDRETGLPLIRI